MTSLEIRGLPFYWRLKAPGDSKSPVPELFDFSFGIDVHGTLIQERRPGLLQNLEAIYSLDYNIGYMQDDYGIAVPYLEDFLGFIRPIVEQSDRSLRILEVGCGNAVVLRRLKGLGHDVVGIDPSPIAEQSGLKHGIEIIPDFLQPGLGIGKFDLIFSIDVLEHAFNPEEFMALCFEYLDVEGTVIASVPDAGPSIETGDVSCAMHQHLQYFSERTLLGLFERSGLQDCLVQKARYGGSLYGKGSVSQRGRLSTQSLSSTLVREDDPIPRMREVHSDVQGFLARRLQAGKRLGIYAPLRALPYLAGLDGAFDSDVFEFIDDTERWNGRVFDGTSNKVQNLVQVMKNPPDEIMIFSLTFERVLEQKIEHIGGSTSVKKLSQFLF